VSRKFLSLGIVLLLVLSTFVSAAPVTFTQLKSRLKQREANLDILDYDQIYANIEKLTSLEEAINSGELKGSALNEAKAEFDSLIEETFLLTFESLNNETRAIWIDNIYMAKLRSREDVANMMDWLQSMNFNVIIPDVFNNFKAVYPSKVVPQHDHYYVFYRGNLLQDLVEEAHARGMHLQPLVVLFGMDTGWDQFLDDLNAFDRDIDGKFVNIYGQAFLSPAYPPTRDTLVELIKEIASYGVDGINLDYIRFSTGFGYGDYISSIWEAFNGFKPHEITENSRFYTQFWEFKAQFVSSFVDRVVKEVQEVNPKVLISADVQSPHSWGKYELAQDHKHWTNNRYLHSLLLMCYTYTAEEFSMHIKNDADHINNQALTYPGMGLYNFDNKEYLRQIEASRGQPFVGQVSFSAIHLGPDKEEYLKKGPYRSPAKNTIDDPQTSAALILEDLALRLELTKSISGLDDLTISTWQEMLHAKADSIKNLDLRSWPDRNLQEPNAEEEAALRKEISEMQNLIKEAGNLGAPGKRVTLELERVLGILLMFRHFASNYSYVPVQY
jgi:uncharacterized lipoprotein YddW (UPF0748 family)